MRKAIAFAAERTAPTAVTWWFAPGGGFIAAGLLWFAGVPVTFSEWLPNPVLRSCFEALVCVVTAYVVTFLVWLAWAPVHFRFKSRGGILVVLKQRGIKQMWPQYLMVLASILFFVAVIGFLQLNVTPPKQKERVENLPANSQTPEHNQSESPFSKALLPSIELDFSNAVLPRVSPPDGTLYLFEVREKDADIHAVIVEHQFGPSEVIDWQKRFPEWPIFGISKCEITSTTNESVFYAVIPINLKFKEMIPDTPGLPPVEVGGLVQAFTGGLQMRSGRVMMKQSSSFKVGRIYPQTPHVIYFVNRTKYLVEIEVPTEGKVQDFSRKSTDFEKKLNMKLGRTTGLYLLTSKSLPVPSPQAPSRQAPSPQETSEKK